MKGMVGGRSMKKSGTKMKKGGQGRKVAAISTKFTGRLLSGGKR